MSDLYRDFIDQKADQIINSLGGTITPAPDNAELYRDFLDRKFDDVINAIDNVLPIGSASGNPTTFYTSVSKPLVSCKTEFMCSQSGSGTPSRQNPRPFNAVNQIEITSNTIPVIFPLGDDYFGGYLDIVNKKITATYRKNTIPTTPAGWTYNSPNSVFFRPLGKYPAKTNGYVYCDIIEPVLPSQQVTVDKVFCGRTNYFNTMINVKVPSTITTLTQFCEEYGGANIVYELATPIEVALSDIPTLSTIIGNNSFASDSGNIDIKYRCLPIDLI